MTSIVVSPMTSPSTKKSEKDYLKELQKVIEDKSTVHLGNDIFSMTAMCFTKAATEKYFLHPTKLS